MYCGRLWTMRQYAAFGDATFTNQRFKVLLGAGQTGLSCAFDLPTRMGLDSDYPHTEGRASDGHRHPTSNAERIRHLRVRSRSASALGVV
jgi:methylmalonyl-CoA mutase N-terminal domain/subunit